MRDPFDTHPRFDGRSAFDRLAAYLRTRTAEHWLFFIAGLTAGAILA